MAEALADFPQAIDNTARIAQMCDLQLDFSKRYAPVYRVPKEKLRSTGVLPVSGSDGQHGQDARATDIQQAVDAALATPSKADDELYLRQLCEDGLTWRYGSTEVNDAVRARLEKELAVIIGKQFCSYFLIVWDFCNYARDNGIPVGARGSASARWSATCWGSATSTRSSTGCCSSASWTPAGTRCPISTSTSARTAGAG
jgi:DNA polymerase-3 subunit alpha